MRSAGFTLIELMVTIAVLAILLFVALPNFSVWMQNTQIRTAGEAALNGMQLARAEAIRRNTSVRFQLVDSLTSSCALSTTGRNWVVSLADPAGLCDKDPAKPDDPDLPTALDPKIIQKRSGGEGSAAALVTITSTDPAGADPATTVTFNGFGGVAANLDGTKTITEIKIDSTVISAADSRELCILVRPGGNIRMCDPNPLVAPTDPRSCGAAVPAGCQ